MPCTSAELLKLTQLLAGDASAASRVCEAFVSGSGQEVEAALSATYAVAKGTARGLDTSFLLFSAYMVGIMQLGFACYAAGVVRARNMVSLLMKNFVDACIAGLMWYLVGHAFAYGAKPGAQNGFIGNWGFALSTQPSADDPSATGPVDYAVFIFNWAFCSAATTILSGAIAERATFKSYLCYSSFMTAFVYPVVTHWLWSRNGWLSIRNADAPLFGIGALDFAGSGVVHLVGGTASLCASVVIGSRIGRFDTSGGPAINFKGSNPALYVIGTFLLWFGWYGFNPGSHMMASSTLDATVISRTAVCSTLASAAGALAALFIQYSRTRTWDLLATCTGALGGFVGVTASAAMVEPWAAVIAGGLSAPIWIYMEVGMEILKIDDPVSASVLHGGCGAWGMIFAAFFAKEEYLVEVYPKAMATRVGKRLCGIVYGGNGRLLGANLIAIAVIIGWTALLMYTLFKIMKMTRSFRVPLECEAMGLDMTAYGAEASQINTFGSTPMAMINYSMHGMTVMDNRHHGGAARGGGGKGAGGGSPTPSRWAATATAGGNGGGGGAGTTAF